MTEERKIRAALKVDASQIQLPADLLDRINRLAQTVTPVRASLWARWRLGPKLEFVAACILLVGLVGVAAYRNFNSSQAPAGGEEGSGIQTEKPKTLPISPPSLSEVRKKASFPVFVPTEVPQGLTPTVQVTEEEPRVLVRISYYTKDGTKGLNVLNGPVGCCLDADPRKTGEPVKIRDNITGHFLVNQPEFGGPILWWQEAGAYVVVSGPRLTKGELVRIAASMSSTADLSLTTQDGLHPAPRTQEPKSTFTNYTLGFMFEHPRDWKVNERCVDLLPPVGSVLWKGDALVVYVRVQIEPSAAMQQQLQEQGWVREKVEVDGVDAVAYPRPAGESGANGLWKIVYPA